MRNHELTGALTAVVLSAVLAVPALGQEKQASKPEAGAEKKPSDAEMMAMMMEFAKPGENHKHLQELVGTWSYAVKWWMSPDAPPMESTGTTVSRSVMDGRYVISEHTGSMRMPGDNGKMMDMAFKGMAVEGYDNVKKRYVSSWIDNMGTGIMLSEGTYEPATKTLTYLAEYEVMPGVKTKARQVIKHLDKDHHTMEYFQDRGGKEIKVMEISYSRKP
ncbi:MAG: DUF1579 domain-containing protein [Limisphaerales bacterium]